MADQGDLNYDRGDMFTNHLKGTHELLLKMPEDITFMARGTWIRGLRCHRYHRHAVVPTPGERRQQRAERRRSRRPRVQGPPAGPVGEQRLRRGRAAGPRTPGQPGDQLGRKPVRGWWHQQYQRHDYQWPWRAPACSLKEAVLPAPMLSVASGLGSVSNVEAYYQFRWNRANCRR